MWELPCNDFLSSLCAGVVLLNDGFKEGGKCLILWIVLWLGVPTKDKLNKL